MATRSNLEAKQSFNVKKLTILAMFSAMAFLVSMIIRIPIFSAAPYLKLDFKDAFIVLAGFIFGPIETIIIAFVVSFIEMVTISESGFIGLVMNVLATVGFSTVAAIVYSYKRTIKGAIFGLALGVISMTIIMMLWNYLITPFYLGTTRADVAPIIMPIIMPFNLIKASINAAITLMIYKPLITALRKTGMINISGEAMGATKKTIGIFIGLVFVLFTAIISVLVYNGVF